jgi:hypothetical protein
MANYYRKHYPALVIDVSSPRLFVPSHSAKEADPNDGGGGSVEMMEVSHHSVVERHITGLGDQVMGRNSIRQATLELRDSARMVRY